MRNRPMPVISITQIKLPQLTVLVTGKGGSESPLLIALQGQTGQAVFPGHTCSITDCNAAQQLPTGRINDQQLCQCALAAVTVSRQQQRSPARINQLRFGVYIPKAIPTRLIGIHLPKYPRLSNGAPRGQDLEGKQAFTTRTQTTGRQGCPTAR